jgi:hypothetical protein
MLTIHEWTTASGARASIDLGVTDGALVVHVEGESPVALPMLVLARVMERYGKPLADGVAQEGPVIDLGEGCTLRRIRHLGRYDVIARDFLVWSAPGKEPLVELAVTISGALTHLAKSHTQAMR